MAEITGAAGVSGGAEITICADGNDVQPLRLVTVYVHVPGSSSETVYDDPLPVIVSPSGSLMRVQAPVPGSPSRTTLPVGVSQEGWVIRPTTGGSGPEQAILIK